MSAPDEPLDGGQGVGGGQSTAASLRRAFDRSFAEAPRSGADALESLLALRVGEEPYVIRLAEVAGVHADCVIVPVPTPVAGLLGVAGVRGAVVPVYDLGALIDRPGAASPRWVLLAASRTPVGLAFERFEAHVRVPRQSVAEAPDASGASGGAGGKIRGAVDVGGVLRPVIRLGSILEYITDRASRGAEPSGTKGEEGAR